MYNSFASFGEFLMSVRAATVAPHLPRDPRLGLQQRGTALGAGEKVPSDGGFLVGTDFAKALVERMYGTGEILSRCLEVPISPGSNGFAFPQFNETSRANGSRMGGAQCFWEDEADTATASRPTFAEGQLKARKIIGLVYLTEELFQDVNALEVFGTAAFSKEMAFALEAAIIGGDGAYRPLGVLNSPALLQVPAAVGQAAGTILAANVVDAWSRCWAPSRKTAVWVVNGEAEKQLITLAIPVGTGGSVIELYHPTENRETQPFASMLGAPVIPSEYCPAVGTVGDLMLCDFPRYIVAMKEAMQTAVSIHIRFLSDEYAFRFELRADGQPIDRVPVIPLNGTATTSSFVAIAAR
jgi:HK97 family phage major capsid protein